MPAREKWWDDVVSSDTARMYGTAAQARKDDGQKDSPGRQVKTFIWGDRVRIVETNGRAIKVNGRDKEGWVNKRHLGGEALLEIYIIDVGQGDGLLVVTPDGHNIMVDGGDTRSRQNSGANAADFVDWKFFKDYTSKSDRHDTEKSAINLDAMVATHNDIDHFGGLLDLIDPNEETRVKLDSKKVTVEHLYHAGLSWWFDGYKKPAEKKGIKRSLGPVENNHYVKLLGNRSSALEATQNLGDPDKDTLNGSWGKFVHAGTKAKKRSGATTPFIRLAASTHSFLPGFSENDPDNQKCSIRVLGPVDDRKDGKPGLKKFPDGTSKNTNGHSVILRVDYADRRIMLTGDLNTHSQNYIMESYADEFFPEFFCDVAKGCHHGSHDVSYSFLEGMRPLATVISSGDTESHDHPRPNIVAASAITGRKLVKDDRMLAPLVFMTEVARSVALAEVGQMKEFADPQPAYTEEKPSGAKKVHDTNDEKARYNLMLGKSQSSPKQWPRLDQAKVVRGLRYGLVNVRTDGKRLFFAQLEEKGKDWAISTLSAQEIAEAR